MAHASRPSAVGRGTLAFLYGLCEVEELPGSYLVEVFGALNMSASGARSYLARAVADGRLVSHRRGRQTAYALNGTFLRRYRTIEQRFISRPDWEGRFHIVIYDIPETRRSERDALRAAARAWPLDEAAQKIRRLAAHLEDVKDRWRDLDASDDSRPALLARVVSAHDMLSSATYVWGTLPALPAQILPADYPHDVLARISAELTGPLMESGSRASARLLAAHRGS
mgnify:FL=1